MKYKIWPKNTRFTSSVVWQSKQTNLWCHYMCTICHPLLIAGETLNTCATSLAGISRDLAHVLNVSPVNRLESKEYASRRGHFRVWSLFTKQKSKMMYVVSTCMEYTIDAVRYSPVT